MMRRVSVLGMWQHLDEWDVVLFVCGLALGTRDLLAIGSTTAEGVGEIGVAAGLGAIVLRRIANPKLLEKESLPPPPPMPMVGLLLVAFAILGTLVTIVGLVLAYALVAEGSHRDRPALDLRVMIVGFPIATAAISAGLLRLARRLRRKQVAGR